MKKTIILAMSLVFLGASIAQVQAETTTITIHQGEMKGRVVNNIATFFGVPYAHNPFTPELRFKAPKPYENWRGVLDATTLKPPVPQPGRGKTVELVGAPSELTLNIWAPNDALKSNKKLPVMVWLPGGAFIREDAGEQVYDGTSFAKSGTIVVTVNYRVGVDGFMHLDGAPDNRGIMDQIVALQWVQKNIADFGGNPHKVTLFGQSAGAESVAILLGTDKTKGLFQKAIMQSPPMQYVTQEQAQRIANTFAEKLGIKATIHDVSQVPFEKLVSAVIDMGDSLKNRSQWGMLSWGGTAFLPVVDGNIIKASPMKDLAKFADPSIAVIVGSTDQEARLYNVPGGAIDRISAAQRTQLLADLSLQGNPLKVYAPAKSKKSIGDSFVDIQSDYTFRMPALHIAENLVKNGNRVWHYNFSWHSPAFGGKLGAAHFVDVPFTFNTIGSDEAKNFVGKQPPQQLAQVMHQNWVRFAKTGTVSWSEYELTHRATMKFDTESAQVDDPEHDVRMLWKDYPF
ncbi:MAG: para-nitrobenzyl esterase [Shewanella sp.]|jgi:para-nitrobenzyl esterase|nr:para-nitrobenzyl esterase [Shewanella sp.]